MICHLCRCFLQDHLAVSAQLAFPKRSVEQILAALPFKVFELAIFPTLKDSTSARSIQNSCKTMETFCGREATIERFLQTYTYFKEVVDQIALELWEAGLAKRKPLEEWAAREFYILFQELLDIHLQHTGADAPTGLQAPLPYISETQKKTPVLVVSTFCEDDLYD